ncbi:HAMP domain-containing protein [Tardiphaga sp. vice352]|uniref:methyl-accepting chemotaxis protein n=1 Tax=unclassified Tardiphaga TaxID=2631404 RepID=UPI001164489B|nr:MULTISPECIES: methyl-accepting chemotaxis protein [unclassified Tardiphaga]QDM15413.1 HAMP domain-containing protein [Tardiphaga sp. vice278]QDM25591.1 HAMP domain-containing protein [Tardiphaga sp. vice304]QDM30798.1 HAMP domain-containing protein [Tardiphaga sp. vice352]
MLADRSRFNPTLGLVPRIVILSVSGILLLGVCVISLSGYFLKRGAIATARERVDANMRVAWEVLRSNGKNFSLVDGKLMADGHVLNGDISMVDKVKDLVGGSCTVFMNDQRIATNVLKPDGMRAVGTQLARSDAYSAIFDQKVSYRGEVRILDEPYMTAYDPIFGQNGELLGILYVGIKKAEFLKAADETFWTIIYSIAAVISIVVIVSYLVARRSVVGPLKVSIVTMNRLAQGDLGAETPVPRRADEIGEIMAALVVFKHNAIEKQRLEKLQAADRAASKVRQEEISQLIGFFGRSMSGSFNSLSGASADMSRTATSLESAAQTTGSQATQVLSEVEQTSLAIQTVAAASQQLSASIGEIGRQSTESARGSGIAMQQAEDVVAKVDQLRQAADEIGNVVKLINSIAAQTNLLALNATIEAARAGEAGRGFAVVAGEVKALAQQTAQATSDIASQVASIQAATTGAAEAIQGISGTVRGVNETAVAIATAVEQQSAATQEIARSIEYVTANAASVTRSMGQVRGAVDDTSGNAAEVKHTSSALSADAATLSAEVTDFLESLRDLGEDRQLTQLDVNLSATALAGGKSVAGRVLRVSPGMVLFDGPLQVAAGTLLEVRIDSLGRSLEGRFVDRVAAGCQIQLLLNHAHLSFMESAMARLAAAA